MVISAPSSVAGLEGPNSSRGMIGERRDRLFLERTIKTVPSSLALITSTTNPQMFGFQPTNPPPCALSP